MEQHGLSAANHIGGVVHGPAVQAGRIEGGVHFHLPGSPVEAPPPEPAPRGWDDLPALPAEARDLLRAQVETARVLPYRLPGARRPSLAAVYVRQDLGSGLEESAVEQPRPMPILDDRGRLVDPPHRPLVRATVRPPTRTVREALNGDDHVLVTGGPGQGKSTLSLRLAADVAERWLAPEAGEPPLREPVVPLRLTARELAKRLGRPFPEAVADCLRAEYGALLGAAPDVRVLGRRVAGCRWLLLVDGLDEVADPAEQERLVAALALWVSLEESPYRVVLTTRPIEGAALAPLHRVGAGRYELQPFDEEALRAFAAGWFADDDRARRFVRQVRAAHLDELVRVPLLATIAAIIFEQSGNRPLPDNQYELYEAYLKYLRSAHPPEPGPFDRVHDALLEHLGRVRLEADTSLVAAAHDWAAEHLPDLVGEWREELTAYLARVGPLTRRGDDLRFLHHSFAEHLAATAKARLLPDGFDPDDAAFAELLHAAHPSERGNHARAVLLHHTRLHPAEAGRLIAWLHEGDADRHLLAARLLAAHAPAGADVVDAFLTTVRSWAMTTRREAEEILAQTARASHHPGMAEWLVGLVRDEAAPWESRVEAAKALAARLRGPASAEAVALLRAVVDDDGIAVEHRLAAAEALSECGGDQREAAEQGLRAVLADPWSDAWDRRTAAVVLAGFGGAARADAAAVLTAMLDDPWYSQAELIQVAAGLAEIGVEFHERCAEFYRAVLRRESTTGTLPHGVARDFASLGHRQAAEAVAALTAHVTDRFRDPNERVGAAETLAELGPQHRLEARGHLLAMTAEPRATPQERHQLAAALTQCGLHREAVDLLRAVLADRTTDANVRLAAAETLADLGPHHVAEVVEVCRAVADHPGSGHYNRTRAWARLARAGEPHRGPAVAALRRVLADPAADYRLRCAVATQLVGLGPEFHGEVAEHVPAIATTCPDPDARVAAWRALDSLGTGFRARSTAELLALMGPDGVAEWEADDRWSSLAEYDFDDPRVFVRAMTAVLGDTALGGDTRLTAAEKLLQLGRPPRRAAFDGILALLDAGVVPVGSFERLARAVADHGPGPRTELASALLPVALDPHATADAVHEVAEALEVLGHGADPDLVAALREVVADELAEPDARTGAAVALARAVPGELARVTSLVLHDRHGTVHTWKKRVRELAALGADVVPGLRVLVSSVDVARRRREAAAELLARLAHDHRDEALAELRAQAADDCLEFSWRTDAVRLLAELDPGALDDAVAYHRTVLADEREPITHRSEAAYQLAHLDWWAGDEAFTALRRFAADLDLPPEERQSALAWLASLLPGRSPEVQRLAVAVVRDPATPASARGFLVDRLYGPAQVEVRREQLADRATGIARRVGGLNQWDHHVLGAEAEAVVRDVAAAVETLPGERVEAVAELARLSPRHVPEAAELLRALSAGRCAADAARRASATLGRQRRREVFAEAERVFADEAAPWVARFTASSLMADLHPDPAGPFADRVRALVHDPRLSGSSRVEMLYYLGELDRIRELRDDARTPPATRWYAANRLRDHAVTDRAAGVRVLDAIAGDPACRPALRWRVAHDLTAFGERGRERGAAALREIAADDALPVIVRADAARVLGRVRPDLRVEVLRRLRELRDEGSPLARVQVHGSIGLFDPCAGARGLQGMAGDRGLGPVVRLRAAEALARLRRDRREAASAVVREIAHDPAVPRHVRLHAARCLADWSDLCRAEAQALLVELGGEG